MNNTYCLTVEDVYGSPTPEVPAGWELTGEFRPPKQGDTFLHAAGQTASVCELADYPKVAPRLILRKKKVPTVEGEYMGQTMEQLKAKSRGHAGFEWTGEFRPVQAGDYFLGAAGGDYVLGPESRGAWLGAHRVIMRKLPTVEDIYGKKLSELKPPVGYEFGEFRRVRTGEDWMDPYGGIMHHHSKVDPPGGAWRLILKKIPTIESTYGAPLDKLTPPKGWRFTGEFRVPKQDEAYYDMEAEYACRNWWPRSDDEPRLILEKLPPSPTIKDVYGTDAPPIPQGWRMKEFRRVKECENVDYLGFTSTKSLTTRPMHARKEMCTVEFFMDGYRIVLERDLAQMRYTTVVSVTDVYGGIPKVPKGYRVVDFRVAEAGEKILATTGIVETAWGNNTAFPRLILERED